MQAEVGRLACAAVHAVGPAAMARNVALLIKELGQVRRRAQLLSRAGAAHWGIEGPLIQYLLKAYKNRTYRFMQLLPQLKPVPIQSLQASDDRT